MLRTFDCARSVQVHNPQEISVITRVQNSQYFPVCRLPVAVKEFVVTERHCPAGP
jgi:hypothetical protein